MAILSKYIFILYNIISVFTALQENGKWVFIEQLILFTNENVGWCVCCVLCVVCAIECVNVCISIVKFYYFQCYVCAVRARKKRVCNNKTTKIFVQCLCYFGTIYNICYFFICIIWKKKIICSWLFHAAVLGSKQIALNKCLLKMKKGITAFVSMWIWEGTGMFACLCIQVLMFIFIWSRFICIILLLSVCFCYLLLAPYLLRWQWWQDKYNKRV